MNLPIQFPSNAEVVAEEAARFRALPPEAQFEVFRGVLAAGEWMMKQSPNSEFVRSHTLEQEEMAMRAVKEFIARHAH
jgi:hypothetical protein